MRKKILIIGGGGYIGSTLTSDFLGKGYSVVCLDLLIYGYSSGVLPFIGHENYKFVHGDMGSCETLKLCVEGVTDVVILAGLVGDPITKNYPEESLKINETAIFEAINFFKNCKIDKLIFVSTCSNYGFLPNDELADEEFELNPLSLYAKSKVKVEKYLLSLKGRIDFCPVILRFATAFGMSPRMRFDLSVSEFAYELSIGNELLVFDADTWRPYCHVKDFSRLIDKVLDTENEVVAFNVFNAGGNRNNSTKQAIVDKILSFRPIGTVRYQENGSDPRNYRVNFDKVKAVLGFTPKYTLDNGIKEVIDSVKSHMFDDLILDRNRYGNYKLIK